MHKVGGKAKSIASGRVKVKLYTSERVEEKSVVKNMSEEAGLKKQNREREREKTSTCKVDHIQKRRK